MAKGAEIEEVNEQEKTKKCFCALGNLNPGIFYLCKAEVLVVCYCYTKGISVLRSTEIIPSCTGMDQQQHWLVQIKRLTEVRTETRKRGRARKAYRLCWNVLECGKKEEKFLDALGSGVLGESNPGPFEWLKAGK
ncbi:hypothetical protein B0H13DRAFT_1887251 [Mycena leptocephala]|nr:hypothetical protein B0H13DRAFT_1887251 [Mycena leptocephala]